MSGLTCNACNREFKDDSEQKLHYKSEWHRYNLKRKVAGVPGVTEALFMAKQAALAEEKKKSNEEPILYGCSLCGKGYRSSKAHAQHLNSRSHILGASHGSGDHVESNVIIKPLPQRVASEAGIQREADHEAGEESGEEWEEVDPEELLVGKAAETLTHLDVNNEASDANMEDGEKDNESYELDPCCCFMCDEEHDTIESCMVHMHKQHGFFIPDVEYLRIQRAFSLFLGLRDFMCLYCNDRCHPFISLEAVRKHMEAKSHCKVHYGDGDDEEEADLEDFYDYSSSYVDTDGNQLVLANDMSNTVELGSGGSELIITRTTTDGLSTKTIGSREFLRYYCQKPRPSPTDLAVTAALKSRYRSMGLATVQSREQMVRMKIMKQMNRSGVEAMRNKIAMKSNVIRNLPKNVPY
ncbi:ZN622/Rei1/Reh1, zinc finger C2H2-type [Dillenia turbinata]|uniref:ZN622/Rei1/Reh1, zinc finger C2H2-type n=1 Tax=Dillenia turbinata TaxID=194707 RepID=A0AAN8YSR6_9MAGN